MTANKVAFMEGNGWSLEWVKIGDLKVDPDVQRGFRLKNANKILADFDPARLTPPLVNRRKGQLYVHDGQHRLWAITQWLGAGANGQMIQCWVRDDAALADLAKDRLAVDAQMRSTAVERFLLSVVAGEAEKKGIVVVLARYGLTVTAVAGVGVVQCVNVMDRIASRPGGIKMLDRVIGILHRAFGTDSHAYHRDLVAALGLLVFKHGTALDEKKAVKVLSTGKGALGIVNDGIAVARAKGFAAPYGVIECFLRLYNKGTRGKGLTFDH